MAESISRSVAKSITWRVVASLCSGVIALGLSISAAMGVMIVDMVLKFILYIGHERLWAGVKQQES